MIKKSKLFMGLGLIAATIAIAPISAKNCVKNDNQQNIELLANLKDVIAKAEAQLEKIKDNTSFSNISTELKNSISKLREMESKISLGKTLTKEEVETIKKQIEEAKATLDKQVEEIAKQEKQPNNTNKKEVLPSDQPKDDNKSSEETSKEKEKKKQVKKKIKKKKIILKVKKIKIQN